MKYQFYAIVYDVAGNQVSSKNSSSPLSVTTSIQYVTSISLDKTSATLNVNGTTTVKATVSPTNANNKNVNWSSSNTSVATVSATSTAKGTAITITAKAKGTATITATAADGSGKSASCSVTVNQPVTGISISKTSATLYLGGTTTTTINATIAPTNANNQTVNWSTSNSNVVAISSATSTSGANITLTAKAKGTATITATAAGDTSKTVTCTVTVYELIMIGSVTTNNYGDYINYPVDLGITSAGKKLGVLGSETEIPVANWKIFYKDSTYAYIIASDFIPKNKFPSGIFLNTGGIYNGYWEIPPSGTTPSESYKNKFLFNKLSIINTSQNNYKAGTYFLNTSLWSSMVNNTYADVAIGSPTIEMFCESWKAKYPSEPLYFGASSSGYTVGKTSSGIASNNLDLTTYTGYNNTLYFPHIGGVWNSCFGYWISSPCPQYADWLWCINNVGILCASDIHNYDRGIRPIVALKSFVKIYEDNNGVWQFSAE